MKLYGNFSSAQLEAIAAISGRPVAHVRACITARAGEVSPKSEPSSPAQIFAHWRSLPSGSARSTYFSKNSALIWDYFSAHHKELSGQPAYVAA